MNLYQLTEAFEEDTRNLTVLFANGEIDEETFQDTLDGFGGDVEKKCLNVAKYIKNIEAEANAIKEESRKMTQRAKTLQTSSDYYRSYLLRAMLKTNLKQIKNSFFPLRIKSSQKVELSGSLDNVDREFTKRPARELDKSVAKKQLIEDRDLDSKNKIDRGFKFAKVDYLFIG